jgi:hypothetical protein
VGLSKERHNLLAGCPCVLCGDRGGSLDRPVPGASYGGPIITSCWVSGPDASFSYALDASIDLKESCQSRHCPSSSNAQQIAQGDLTCPNFFILITHTHTHTHTHIHTHSCAANTGGQFCPQRYASAELLGACAAHPQARARGGPLHPPLAQHVGTLRQRRM